MSAFLRKSILFILLLSLWIVHTSNVDSKDANAKIKAVFVYNFTKYIEWPESYKQGDFKIGIVGNDQALLTELKKMAQIQKAGLQSISVQNTSSVNEINQCHIVYIVSDKSDELSKAVEKVKNTSTLIVTEKPGLIDKGAGINFVTTDNKQKFELNKNNITKYNLEVSSKLLPFASLVK